MPGFVKNVRTDLVGRGTSVLDCTLCQVGEHVSGQDWPRDEEGYHPHHRDETDSWCAEEGALVVIEEKSPEPYPVNDERSK